MKVSCEYGYYKFYPEDIPAIRKLKNIFGLEVVQHKNFYTFPALKTMPNYSVLGYPLGFPFAITPSICKKTFSGDPELVLKNNLLVYNIKLKNITELAASLNVPKPSTSDLYCFNFLPQAGCILGVTMCTSFYGEIDFTTKTVRIEGFYE